MQAPSRHHAKSQVSSPTFRTLALTVIAALVAIASLTASSSEAAQIVFNKDNVNVTLKPGENQTITYAAKLTDTTMPSPYVVFTQVLTGGNIDPTWISSSYQTYLRSADNYYGSYFYVRIPAGAEPGQYTAVFTPMGIISNESITTSSINFTVEVEGEVGCNQPPEFAEVTSLQQTIQSKDNQPITFSFIGTINTSEKCPITKAWYELTDEYGILDETKPVVVNSIGQFSVAIPVDATRKGTDKDGRVYTIVFGAENEAGTTMGGGKKITITHDNRDKNPNKVK